ncbi:hypothetical protein [Almyronema epifaneia]|uniref:Uncharacterized protein n=1 Tax=Almyronema epifaneia S1 TaxID=2991925 RepID=A0ABW6IAC5_9CYAN
MKDFPIRNIFLPAVLVAGSVFSALTLPAVLKQTANDSISQLPVFNQAAAMSLGQVHKDVAIPYIGSVIVLSAGAGIATAELARKRQVARQKAAAAKATQPAAAPAAEPLLAALPLASATFEWPTEAPTASPEPVLPSLAAAADSDSSHTVVIFPGQYQRCRIQVPHLQEQLYAIEFDQQFYSLLSAGLSKAQALAAIEQLSQEDRAAILTRMNQGYAVWVQESQAQLVSVA